MSCAVENLPSVIASTCCQYSGCEVNWSQAMTAHGESSGKFGRRISAAQKHVEEQLFSILHYSTNLFYGVSKEDSVCPPAGKTTAASPPGFSCSTAIRSLRFSGIPPMQVESVIIWLDVFTSTPSTQSAPCRDCRNAALSAILSSSYV